MAIHALERLRKRYDSDLTYADLNAIQILLIAGEGIVSRTEDTGRQLVFVRYGGKRIKIIWAPDIQRIITALPLKGRKRAHNHRVYRAGRLHQAVG